MTPSSLRKFKISIVSLNDLKKMNISKTIMGDIISRHSSSRWGFILLSFKKKDEYCPVAYTHDIVGDNVFVPQCPCTRMYTVSTTREPKIPGHCEHRETTFLKGNIIGHIELPEVIVVRKYEDESSSGSITIFGIDHEGSDIIEYKPDYDIMAQYISQEIPIVIGAKTRGAYQGELPGYDESYATHHLF